ncbi:MAG: beta-ketoacyl synthase N-terminal-like domain-containing protein [Candidatus Anammoxibacter sp.]
MSIPNPIAIVGIGGIFPGSSNLDQFWRNILNKVNVSCEVPKGRWPVDVNDVYSSQKGAKDKLYSRRACFVDDFQIDPSGLDIDQQFLVKLDPLFHLALHAGREAFVDCKTANIDKKRCKVIIGNIVLPSQESSKLAMEYLGKSFDEKVTGNKYTGDYKSVVDPVSRFVAGLPGGVLAKALGFGGGSYTLDAACASSLYAISLAMDELLAGRADAVLAGGVSRPDCFYTQMGFSQLLALSPNGVCSPFDKESNGLVVGEGAGMFMLKRLQDAIDDGDYIYGCIKSVGLSNDVDGSLLAPSSEGQLRAMRQAYDAAGWAPGDVDLIECHGAGTPVGDAVEFQSLKNLWGETGWDKGQCVIGSVKSNIGHLLTAAGGAALMKVILSLKENVLPPTANFKSAREGIDIDNAPFRLLTESASWERRDSATPRRAGVSAFGFGGINAHMLVEEWMPEVAKDSRKDIRIETVELPFRNEMEVAITGMDTHFGNWDSLAKFRKRLFGSDDSVSPEPSSSWWGAQECEWFKRAGLTADSFKGFYINEFLFPLNRFRIPPKELEEILPQQLLMLKVADGAISDGNLAKDELLNTAVIIGIGLDLNTTNFHFRWMMKEKAKMIAKHSGLNITEQELEDLASEFMDLAGPALNANRTLGALGGVVASRIAREFRLGGPSFTVSNEECSGIRAVETAVRLLQTGRVRQAVVGAVDLAGDIRAVLPVNVNGHVPSDGAAAIVIKPLEDAVKAGDKIYAVIKGIGSTTGQVEKSYKTTLKNAYDEAGITFDNVDLIETYGNGQQGADSGELAALLESFGSVSDNSKDEYGCAVSSVRDDIGHSGAASGLASLVKTALCVYHKTIPGNRNSSNTINGFFDNQNKFYLPLNSRYWLRNKSDGPRRAGVSSLSMDGNCAHVVLEEYEGISAGKITGNTQLAVDCAEGLFVIESDDFSDLKQGIKHLQELSKKYSDYSVSTLAGLWWCEQRNSPAKKNALTMVVSSHAELMSLLEKAYNKLNTGNGYETLNDIDRNNMFFAIDPIGHKGELAFVYPGSGNHYPGMGRELLTQWPEVVNRQEEFTDYLKTQLSPQLFWNEQPDNYINKDKRGVLLAQVSIGCFITDLLNSFSIKPQAAIGYSLGESTCLLSLKVWKDRDEMMRRIMKSELFVNDLAGRYNAARATWGLTKDEDVKWVVGIVFCPEEIVKRVVEKRKRVYLLIVNTPKECVVGGDEDFVKEVVDELGCKYIQLDGVTIAHCEIVKHVFNAYRDFHLFDVMQPDGIRIYSGAWEKSYEITSQNTADSIATHATEGFHFPRLIEKAYNDGVRVFVEIGPGSSCCRMIDKILGDRSHVAVFATTSGKNEVSTTLRLVARLIAERVDVDLGFLYSKEDVETILLKTAGIKESESESMVVINVSGKPFKKSKLLASFVDNTEQIEINELNDRNAVDIEQKEFVMSVLKGQESMVESIRTASEAKANVHESFLSISNNMAQAMTKNIELQLSLIGALNETGDGGGSIDLPADFNRLTNIAEDNGGSADVAFDRDKCMEFAIGKIGNVLGERYAEIDEYPTRVRLPDEPMMFVDRILLVEGTQFELKSGRIVTEHDILEDAWYLDCNRIPTCVAVEAGQADLFLSGYLGIDFETKGVASYRLLDAVITFYRELPGPGEVIKYDIHIDHFFKHGNTYLFRFGFEATVNGEPLLSMKDGCAGFFTPDELSSGKGIIDNDKEGSNGKHDNAEQLTKPFAEIVPMGNESYTETQLDELRTGNLPGCFGDLFDGLNIRQPSVIPGNMMKLVDRITDIDPDGGSFGLGFVRGEFDIHKDDWFLTCHFIDDRVMPGTLMYECCMHTLRVYLLRMGWVGEKDELIYQPVPGVASGLKCRGQVIESTKMAAYEISVKKIGYGPDAYVICDALLFADDRAIVKIYDMSLMISGLTEDKVNKVWGKQSQAHVEKKSTIFDSNRILAFAIGKPSDAFGKQYEKFDRERKIARLPGPPYQFLDRIVSIDAEQWQMVSGGEIEAEYDIPVDAWYFRENCQKIMPFAILLEIALQPCGWLAAYVGSALTSDIDLRFRNLGGSAIIRKPVYCDTGTLSTTVKLTNVSKSGGMIIQHYDFHVRNDGQTVYKGNTYFGFFTKEALAQQIGIRDANIYQPTESESARGLQFEYPEQPPYPAKMMRMVDRVELFVDNGGSKGLGLIQGVKDVNPEEWFFKAHFYQDPVCPGSLGLESFLQLLKVVAIRRWGDDPNFQIETIALNEEHSWIYRGQVIPEDKKIFVEAIVTEIDDKRRLIKADGFLSVDQRVIYQMTNFTVKVSG